MSNKIAIYQSPSGQIKLKVDIAKNTVWLTLNQISQLFNTDNSGISRHIKNIYKDEELVRKSTIAKIATVQTEGNRKINRQIIFYNLDLILSVGYRVSSKKATQFRIWATNILKKYITKGYVANQTRLAQLQQTIKLISIKSHTPSLKAHQSEIIELINNYANSLDLLKQYDNKNIKIPKLSKKTIYKLSYSASTTLIQQIKNKIQAPDIFGQEYPHKLESIIKNLDQTFNKQELYPSIEEKAANLLYFVIKDHPFVDGNKRIASTLFIYFLSKNNYLYKTNGEIKINDRALVALALLIATSNPKEKNTMVNLTVNLIK